MPSKMPPKMSSQMPLTIYHSAFARSARILWLCEEAGIPYEVSLVENTRAFLQTPDYLALHPMGKIPVITHGDTVLFESLAIMEYLMAKHPNELARAPDHPDFAAYLQWFHFGESTLGEYVTLALGHKTLFPEKVRIPAIADWAEREVEKCYKALEGPLSQHDFLLPSGFSAADISVGYMLLLAKFAKVFDSVPEAVRAYFDRIKTRPAWQVATAK